MHEAHLDNKPLSDCDEREKERDFLQGSFTLSLMEQLPQKSQYKTGMEYKCTPRGIKKEWSNPGLSASMPQPQASAGQEQMRRENERREHCVNAIKAPPHIMLIKVFSSAGNSGQGY